MKLAAIALHVDSLNEAYGFPPHYEDPTYHQVLDRFLSIVKEFDFKATFFVIGRDLLNDKNRLRVKQLVQAGHEVASHSFNHRLNLGALPKYEIENEILRAHIEIENTIGMPPFGFASPNWSSSNTLLEVVSKMGYSYDASLFPSWLRFPAAVKSYFHCLLARNGRAHTLIHQKDFSRAIFGSPEIKIIKNHASATKSLVLLPVPVNRYRIASWHTLAFVFGQKVHESILRSCLHDREFFYYVIHPADLLDKKELDPNRSIHLARLDVSLEKKLSLLRSALEIIVKERRLVPMVELAKSAIEFT